MTHVRLLGAIALGCSLAAVPFLRYRFGSPHPTAHSDHGARHGGVLGMVGDLHLEVVRRGGRIEVYTSDAYRRPLEAIGGDIAFGDGSAAPLTWEGTHLVGADDAASAELKCTVLLEDGRSLEMSVEAEPSPRPRVSD
jgi:hypothetical protein